MKTKSIEFSDLERKVVMTGKSFKDIVAGEMGKAYVIAISRDGCPACQRQKPKFDRLAKTLSLKDDYKAVFLRIHIKYSDDLKEEASRSKDTLGHYFFPTNVILVRTRDRGAIELYRGVSPRMSELKRNIALAAEIAGMLGKS